MSEDTTSEGRRCTFSTYYYRSFLLQDAGQMRTDLKESCRKLERQLHSV